MSGVFFIALDRDFLESVSLLILSIDIMESLEGRCVSFGFTTLMSLIVVFTAFSFPALAVVLSLLDRIGLGRTDTLFCSINLVSVAQINKHKPTNLGCC